MRAHTGTETAAHPSVTRIRVRYPETDHMGVAHHSHFFVWFEIGRTELMRERGCPYDDLEKEGTFFPVIDAGTSFKAPARYDDELTVETTLSKVGGVRVRFDYRLLREPGGELLATGFTEHASVNAEKRPQRISEELRGRLLALGRGAR